MRAVQRFFVRPTVPESLAGLTRLATNLAWTWDHDTQALFERLDPTAWHACGNNPVELLHRISPQRWDELAADPGLVAEVRTRVAHLDDAVQRHGWFQQRTHSPLDLVAYFSPEFGLSETLPQYSGGLGVLAGDHLKAASDLGIPLVGVGLLYREGYFRQRLDATGWQRERFPRLDPASLALHHTGKQVSVMVGASEVRAAVWRVDVGRIPLYLLDTDLEDNDETGRAITDRLYGGDMEHRLRQEIVLGIGGVRALRELGLAPQVFHTNEGHAGFLALERVREFVRDGLTFASAVEAVRAGGLFTTHTPVPAGIDRYPRDLMSAYFGAFCHDLGCSFDELMTLGHDSDDPDGPRFNMAALGLRMAARSNAVAALHGEVSRRMFHHLWPGALERETPITSVTNGVHAKTWVAPRIDALLSAAVNPVWDGADADTWARAHHIDAHELWQVRRAGRAALVDFVRNRLRADVLEPDTLTIGFARRFATYKRATLLLSQPERLRAMLLSADRPVQFVFAGKAHPADEPGKLMIQAIERYATELDVAHRFVFLQDYDMGVARMMYQGCDVWLNTPRRPLEACGTSGMKAALNGALNCSIADGWWDECADGRNGWVITSSDDDPHAERRDQREALNLFNILEGDVVPLFYDGSPPLRWIDRMKHAWATLGPYVTAARMVKDYTTTLYEPAAAQSDRFAANHGAAAADLAQWKSRTRHQWGAVRITSFVADESSAAVTVDLAGLSAGDVACDLVHGPVDPNGVLVAPVVEPLALVGESHGSAEFRGTYEPAAAGPYGSTVRVRAHHPLLANAVETGHITWAG